MAGSTIAIEDQGTLRKITKIVPYNSGGFAVLAPYHKAQKGYLFKHPVDYSQRRMEISREDNVEYSAEDRVKLSLHPDGFIQFSGENPGKIVSGRDPDTGDPRGLGIMSHPLDTPINTGPTFGCVAWGVADFESLDGIGKSNVIAFAEEDYYYRACTPDTWNGYLIEGFVLEERYWGATRHRGGKLLLTVMPMFEAIGAVFEFRVVPLPGQPLLLGMLVSRVRTEFQSPSGFTLSGPADVREELALAALYPAPQDLEASSLDYR
ncbi:MAG TPA: hypothetical protein VFJ72_00365 [Rubrobacteraceae bacterium]|nr:hypothetical protein [Rubrobacteraceae bacterium]